MPVSARSTLKIRIPFCRNIAVLFAVVASLLVISMGAVEDSGALLFLSGLSMTVADHLLHFIEADGPQANA